MEDLAFVAVGDGEALTTVLLEERTREFLGAGTGVSREGEPPDGLEDEDDADDDLTKPS